MWILTIKRANCKNCYKCVRTCPVKAIKIKGDQAEVDPARCILCGQCLSACPQKAKEYRHDLNMVKSWLAAGEKVVASLAPSFPAAFPEDDPDQIKNRLHKLGFALVEETARGAAAVAKAFADLVKREREQTWISTACPVVVNLVKKHFPDLLHCLTPLVSPMAAHGRMLKQEEGPSTKVVFIGPCLAKKEEMTDPQIAGEIDAVLTFEELQAWLAEDSFMAGKVAETAQEVPQPGREFPLVGGLFATAGLQEGIPGGELLSLHGIDDCLTLLQTLSQGVKLDTRIFDLTACRGSCVAGPCQPAVSGFLAGRDRVRRYALSAGGILPVKKTTEPFSVPLGRSFTPAPAPRPQFSEEQIRKVLAATGKLQPEDELNCGACGYPSCREKAIAVLSGAAELSMCMPYMQRKAESQFAKVKEETLEKAQKVIARQMRVAQEIAGLLGETTAESKTLLLELIKLVQNGEGGAER